MNLFNFATRDVKFEPIPYKDQKEAKENSSIETPALFNVATTRFKSQPVTVTYSETQLRAFFKRLDANGDGKLDRKELTKAFKELGSKFPWWRVGRAIYYADGNKDGCINEGEIEDLVKYAMEKGYKIR